MPNNTNKSNRGNNGGNSDQMVIELRFYKRFDSDLIALQAMGIKLSILAKNVVEAYAHGKRISFMIPYCEPYDIESRNKPLHLSFTVKSKEAKELLLKVRKGYRNQFCKSLIRDALILNPLWPYFYLEEGTGPEDERIRQIISDQEEYKAIYGIEMAKMLVPGKSPAKYFSEVVEGLSISGNKNDAADRNATDKRTARENKGKKDGYNPSHDNSSIGKDRFNPKQVKLAQQQSDNGPTNRSPIHTRHEYNQNSDDQNPAEGTSTLRQGRRFSENMSESEDNRESSYSPYDNNPSGYIDTNPQEPEPAKELQNTTYMEPDDSAAFTGNEKVNGIRESDRPNEVTPESTEPEYEDVSLSQNESGSTQNSASEEDGEIVDFFDQIM